MNDRNRQHRSASRSCVAALLAAAALFPTSSIHAQQKVAPVPELPTFDKTDAAKYGIQIADYADRFDQGWRDEYSQSSMTLYNAAGDSVVRKSIRIVLDKPEGDKSIIRFLAPAEIKSVAALTHERPDAVDDNWLYLPASKRVRRISGANKTASFQGTEFTYEDLSNLIVKKYRWKFLGEGELEIDGQTEPVYRLEAVPQYRNTGYSKLIVSINSARWRRESIEFFDKAGRRLKVLKNGDWKHHHGRFWRPDRIEMVNLQTKKRTVIAASQTLVDLGQYKSRRTGKPRKNLTDAQFTTRALEGR